MATKKASPKKAVTKPAKKLVKKASAKKAKASQVCSCHATCKAGESFWVNYGPVVDSISALRDAVKAMSPEQFEYHTKQGRNDFALWIRHCFDNKKVADRVEKATTKNATLQALRSCCK